MVTLQVGSRRPLGTGAGGLAILSALDAAERQPVLGQVLPALESNWGLQARDIRASIAAFDRTGFAFIRNRLHVGVSAVGVPFRDTLGQPVGALSIAAINERMKEPQPAVLAGHLHDAARELRSRLNKAYG